MIFMAVLRICLLFCILNGVYVSYVVMKVKYYQLWDVSKVLNISEAILMERTIGNYGKQIRDENTIKCSHQKKQIGCKSKSEPAKRSVTNI